MKKPYSLCLLWLLVCLFWGNVLHAQPTVRDSSSQQAAFSSAVNTFRNSLSQQSPLYNGPAYYYYDPTIKGNAYFQDINGLMPGSVTYDGGYYPDIKMMYDIYSDNVVVLLYNNFTEFFLVKQKVSSFNYLNHHFVNINADTITNNKAAVKSGFYDELYDGKTPVLVKRYKTIQSITGGMLLAGNYFSLSQEYYLKKNNVYYKISGQGDLLDVFKDRKKDIQQYIKKDQIKFRRDPETTMVKIASYYDHLSQ